VIDATLITRKAVLITEDLKVVDRYAGLELSEYLSDRLNQLAAERCLERIINRMIDINYHVITERGNPPPRDYFESFLGLGQLGVLPMDFARALAPVAGLRNRLVHEYNELDHAKIHEALRSASRDVPLYLAHITRIL